MGILYLGDNNPSSTSYHRAMALVRLGNKVDIYNPLDAGGAYFKNKIIDKINFRTGYKFIQRSVKKWLIEIINKSNTPDLIWVNGGEAIGAECMRFLKEIGCPIILYNNDDPTGGRDGQRFNTLIEALPYYDLCAVMRDCNVEEFTALGAKNVLRVTMSYDEIYHMPFAKYEEIPPEFISEVAFVGTWMRNENRDIFLIDLIKAGLPISIWGNRWQKSPYWDQLKNYYRGGALGGRDYVAAIQGAKISIGMLSKGNRDLHTQRSLEIPFIGGLLCAERTSEHLEMYVEGKEALFWSDSSECAEVCKKILQDDLLREKIRSNGMEKVRRLKIGNEDICKKIIDYIFILKSDK